MESPFIIREVTPADAELIAWTVARLGFVDEKPVRLFLTDYIKMRYEGF